MIYKIINSLWVSVAVLFAVISVVPQQALAQPAQTGGAVQTGQNRDYSGLVKCDGFIKDANNKELPGNYTECNLAAIVSIVQALISWFFGISGSLAALLFMYGGVLYLSNNPSNIEKAHQIFTNTALGIGIVATAWLFVKTILEFVVKPEYLSIVTTFFGK